MRMLITGGAGFIGSNFARYVEGIHPDWFIRVLDKLTYAGSRENLKGVSIDFFRGDVARPQDVYKALEGIECVVHFAAESHVTRSETQKEIFMLTNFYGTYVAITESIKQGVKLLVHVSTDEVYGPCLIGKFKEEGKEKGDHQATSVYAKSKALADDLVQTSFPDLPIIIVRPTNCFGPYQHPEKMIPRAITRILRGEKIIVWGEGKQIRDWLFVEDLCKAILLLIEKGQPGQIYNVGAENEPEITNLDLAKKICEIFGDIYRDAYELIPDPRPLHDFRYAVDPLRIQALGWQPSDFMGNLERTIQWYKQNEIWWQERIAEAERIYQHEKKEAH